MIEIIDGDIFNCDADVILHQVNCRGVMGSGVAKQVREKFPWVYGRYKKTCDKHKKYKTRLLGHVQEVFIDEDRVIVNLFAQENFGYDGKCYTDYNALESCLYIVNDEYKGRKIAIPYLMGCHRGGGNWDYVYSLIEKCLSDCDVTLYKYTAG